MVDFGLAKGGFSVESFSRLGNYYTGDPCCAAFRKFS